MKPKMKKNYTIRYENLSFINRWSQHGSCGDWTIIGISKWWHSSTDFCYKFCLFGLEAHIWFKRDFGN